MPEPPAIDVLTPPGRGAVAVVACTGDVALLDGADGSPALCAARDGRPFRDRAINRITFARWGSDHPEDVVVCRISANEFEVHCHGGRAAVERIQGDLLNAIGRGSSRREHGNADQHQQLLAAAWEAVSRATTLRTADLLLHQAAEAWPRLLATPATGREGEAPAEPDSENDLRSSSLGARPARQNGPLTWARFGQHLTAPWIVALVGQPNAGKSSLMNALAGFQRSIVNPTPGTTRDAVTLDVAFDGWPVRLVDTAGLREAADELESAGIKRAHRAIQEADLILHVFDATRPQPALLEQSIPVANKIDLRPNSSWPARVAAVSALDGTGVKQLIERIVTALIPKQPPRGLAIPVCPEHIAWRNSLTPNS
jgi:tRNA modification GTPase